MLQVAKVLANHLLGQSLPGDEDVSYGVWAVLDKALLHQVPHPLLWFLIEEIKSYAVGPLALPVRCPCVETAEIDL